MTPNNFWTSIQTELPRFWADFEKWAEQEYPVFICEGNSICIDDNTGETFKPKDALKFFEGKGIEIRGSAPFAGIRKAAEIYEEQHKG